MDGIGAMQPVTPAGVDTVPNNLPAPADGAIATPGPVPVAPAAHDNNGTTAGRRPGQYTQSEQAEIRALRARDRKVRAHEQAHLAAAGPHARGGPSYRFETGPDGRRYAVGGEVQIDTSPASDPAATLAKALKIQRAALAPAEPSPRDRRVAAEATAMAAGARAELSRQRGNAYPVQDRPGRAMLIDEIV